MYGLAKIANDYTYRDQEILGHIKKYRKGMSGNDQLEKAESQARLFNYIRRAKPRWDKEQGKYV